VTLASAPPGASKKNHLAPSLTNCCPSARVWSRSSANMGTVSAQCENVDIFETHAPLTPPSPSPHTSRPPCHTHRIAATKSSLTGRSSSTTRPCDAPAPAHGGSVSVSADASLAGLEASEDGLELIVTVELVLQTNTRTARIVGQRIWKQLRTRFEIQLVPVLALFRILIKKVTVNVS
jgi:hypothetical protein